MHLSSFGVRCVWTLLPLIALAACAQTTEAQRASAELATQLDLSIANEDLALSKAVAPSGLNRYLDDLLADVILAAPKGASSSIAPRLVVDWCGRPTAYAGHDDEIRLCIGAIRRLQTRDELAFLIAHELGHIALNHADRDRGRAAEMSTSSSLRDVPWMGFLVGGGLSGFAAGKVQEATGESVSMFARRNYALGRAEDELTADQFALQTLVAMPAAADASLAVLGLNCDGCESSSETAKGSLSNRRYEAAADALRRQTASDVESTTLPWIDADDASPINKFLAPSIQGDQALERSLTSCGEASKTISGAIAAQPDNTSLARQAAAIAVFCGADALRGLQFANWSALKRDPQFVATVIAGAQLAGDQPRARQTLAYSFAIFAHDPSKLIYFAELSAAVAPELLAEGTSTCVKFWNQASPLLGRIECEEPARMRELSAPVNPPAIAAARTRISALILDVYAEGGVQAKQPLGAQLDAGAGAPTSSFIWAEVVERLTTTASSRLDGT